jgi:hypothetical protein
MEYLRCKPNTKQEGLQKSQNKGWLLVDATYEPVNDPSKNANDIIIRDYPQLRSDLATILPDRSVPIVLVKANVCRLLEPLLLNDGFNVINRGRVIYFPSTGNQSKFR